MSYDKCGQYKSDKYRQKVPKVPLNIHLRMTLIA